MSKYIYTFQKPCAHCGEMFSFKAQSYNGRNYCSRSCLYAVLAVKAQNRQAKKKLANMKFGEYALEADPWATGQLPESVRANALWG